MQIVPNPSEQLLSHPRKGRQAARSCSADWKVTPLLCDVQALASTSYFGTPRRTVGGADTGAWRCCWQCWRGSANENI